MKKALNFYPKTKLLVLNKLFLSLFLMCATIPLLAQQGNVTGTIVDEFGESLIGVTIAVEGTGTGAYSDMDGNFSVIAEEGNTLVISYIGFITQKITVTSPSQNLRIVLLDDTHTLSEVVVVGYGSLEKKQVTSSISSLKAENLPVGVGGATVATALVGRVSGLTIDGTGSPNAENKFQLRGPASINSSQEPLVVIDGMPGGDLRSLVQEDILSIDVLKDASAGAIYGTRAAAGVILVTTKSGQASDGKVKLTYSGELSVKQAFGRPAMMNAKEFVEHDLGTDWKGDSDWWGEALADNTTSQKHTISLQTGTKTAQLYASFMYQTNKGVIKFEDRTDYAGRINSKFKLFDGWLDIDARADYRQAFRNKSSLDMEKTFRNNPTRAIYDDEHESGYNIWTGDSNQRNTISDAANYTDEGIDKWFRPDVSFKLNILPIPGLSYQQTVAYELRQWEGHKFHTKYHTSEVEAKRTGTANLKFSKTENLNTEGYFTYVTELGDHYFNAVAGYSFFEQNGESFEMTNRNYTSDGVKFWDIGKGTGQLNVSNGAEMKSKKEITERLMAYFGRLNYSYKDRYMATATVRREGSSKFAKNNQWGTFWALSGGWRVSEESFMKNISWISELKLRLAYGVTGNNGFDAKYAATMYGSDQYWLMPDGNWLYTYGKSENINPDLKWEEKAEWNFGIDYAFLNNRIYGKLDIYRRKVNDLIYKVNVSAPPYTKTSMHQNIGNMENRGWEFEIGADIVRTKDWSYSTNFNITQNKNKLTYLDGNQSYIEKGSYPTPGSYGTTPIRIEEGSTIGSFFLYKYAGLDADGKWLVYDKNNEIIPISKANRVTDKHQVGNYNPKVIIGWTQNLRYKNFDLGITCVSWLKFDVYNTFDMYLGLPNTADPGFNMLKNAYKKNGHIYSSREPIDYFLEDGSFFKIQNINLGYTQSLKKYNKYIESARLYMTINNVAKFTGYSGSDPEQSIVGLEGGIDYFNKIYPQVRTYTFGVQLNF